MELNFNLPALLNLAFNDDEALYAQRTKAHMRRPRVAYPGRALVINEPTARMILAADPDSEQTYIQVLTDENQGDPVFLLWRRAEWNESVERQLEMRAHSEVARTQRARRNAANEWLSEMSNRMSRTFARPPEHFMIKLVDILRERGINGLQTYIAGVEELLDGKSTIWIPLSETQRTEVETYIKEQK